MNFGNLLRDSYSEIGQLTQGHILGGHGRVQLVLRNEEESIPIVYVSLSEEEELQVLATYDMITRLRVPDGPKLAELLQEIELPNALGDLATEFADLENLDLSGPIPDVSGGEGDSEGASDTEVCSCCGQTVVK